MVGGGGGKNGGVKKIFNPPFSRQMRFHYINGFWVSVPSICEKMWRWGIFSGWMKFCFKRKWWGKKFCIDRSLMRI